MPDSTINLPDLVVSLGLTNQPGSHGVSKSMKTEPSTLAAFLNFLIKSKGKLVQAVAQYSAPPIAIILAMFFLGRGLPIGGGVVVVLAYFSVAEEH